MFSVQHAYCPSAPKTAFSPQVRPPISEKTYSLSNLSYIQSKYPIKGVSPERHKETFNILCKKLPYELAQEILDLAEFWELRTERVEFGEKGKDVSYMLNEKLVEVGLSGKVREVIVVGWVIEELNEFINDLFGDPNYYCTFEVLVSGKRRPLPITKNIKMNVDMKTRTQMIFRHWNYSTSAADKRWQRLKRGDTLEVQLVGNFDWASNVKRVEISVACSYR